MKYGWTDGQNIRVDYRWPEGDPTAAKRYAEELVAARADVLVGTNTFAINALRAATNSIPIVFVNVTDPIASGMVASLARPGANITGFTDMDPAIAGKWVEFLKMLVPPLDTVAMVYNPESAAPFVGGYIQPFEYAARNLDMRARIEHVKAREDYAPVLEACARDAGCGVILIDDALFARNLEYIVALANKNKVPAMYTNQGYVTTYAGLIAYGINLSDQYIQSAEYIDKILHGEKPADLPVQMPTTFRLAVNQKTASAMGIGVPQAILMLADRVIE